MPFMATGTDSFNKISDEKKRKKKRSEACVILQCFSFDTSTVSKIPGMKIKNKKMNALP